MEDFVLKLRILQLEDDVIKHSTISRVIGSAISAEIDWVTDMASGIEKIEEAISSGNPYDLAITDMHYPLSPSIKADWEAGDIFAAAVKSKYRNLPVVICSTHNRKNADAYSCIWYNDNHDWESQMRNVVKRVYDEKNNNKERKEQTPKTNSIIRALTVLEVLRERTDEKHSIQMKELLDQIREAGGYSTDKTLKEDIHNLKAYYNPVDEDYATKKDAFRIVHDRIGEGTNRITNLRYIHELSNEDVQLLMNMVQSSDEIGKEQKRRYVAFLKKQGSVYYNIHENAPNSITEYSTLDGKNIQHNIDIFCAAMEHNHKAAFMLNVYNKDGEMVPVRERMYEVNPYYVAKYNGRYYLFATHGKHSDTHIYRMDLMTEAMELDEKRESVRGVEELNNSNAREYMMKHLNMFYDRPSKITIKLMNDSYTYLHDAFGDNYTWKRHVDDRYDEVEVVASEEATINWALTHRGDVEIIRPRPVRQKMIEQLQQMLKQYGDEKR